MKRIEEIKNQIKHANDYHLSKKIIQHVKDLEGMGIDSSGLLQSVIVMIREDAVATGNTSAK